jgi:catechol 2,3-dioxygenase-like lactoylglutathione lyase family enzyme
MATVRYMVGDVDRALEFYTGMLGFALKQRWGRAFAMAQRGDLVPERDRHRPRRLPGAPRGPLRQSRRAVPGGDV